MYIRHRPIRISKILLYIYIYIYIYISENLIEPKNIELSDHDTKVTIL